MFGNNLAIIDLETTGTYGLRDRIIEIAILRIEKEKIVDTYTTLINPQTYVSPFIEQFTGISKEELETAPLFSDVKDRVLNLLDDAIFIAHNARFDYSFIKTELRRLGIQFKAKTFCTVQLSRRLFPQYSSHSLESIIQRYKFTYKNRHRAYDDAHILWQFIKKIKKEVPNKKLKNTWQILAKALPLGKKEIQKQVDKLPESPGIYMFYDKNHCLLYIGRSKNINERVIGHFSAEVSSKKLVSMTKEIHHIDHIQTSGELGAMLMEFQLMREYTPKYSRQPKKDTQCFVLYKTKTSKGHFTLSTILMSEFKQLDFESVLGIYASKKIANNVIKFITEKYHLCKKIMGIDDSKLSCLNFKSKKCKGACIKKELVTKYNNRFLIAFLENREFRSWPYTGTIEIIEKNEFEGTCDCFQFNQWCLCSSKKNNDEIINYNYQFDINVYKILNRYLKTHDNYMVIKSDTKHRHTSS